MWGFVSYKRGEGGYYLENSKEKKFWCVSNNLWGFKDLLILINKDIILIYSYRWGSQNEKWEELVSLECEKIKI